MTNLVSKILEFLMNPMNKIVVIATFLSSLLLFSFNFIPEKLLIRTHMLNFFNQYTFIIVIIMIFTFFLLIIQTIAGLYKSIGDRKIRKRIEKEQEKLFNDHDALIFLKLLYEHHPQSVNLPLYNQKVKLLEQFLLIKRVGNMQLAAVYEINNPSLPYVLQPHAEERMKTLHQRKN